MDMGVIECIRDQNLIIHEGKSSHENPVSAYKRTDLVNLSLYRAQRFV